MTGVIYARYSSDNQREESIEGQIRENTAFAEKNGIVIVGHYIDRAYSAKTDNRPEFQRMIRDSAKKTFDVVIVWKLDRFSRNRYDSAKYKAEEKYVLTTKLFCGKCHTMMVGDSAQKKNGNIYRYYKCASAKRHECDKKAVRKEWIEELEAEEEQIELNILKEQTSSPKLTKEQILFALDKFRKLDLTIEANKERLIDSLVKCIILYDDKLIITFNFKNEPVTVPTSEEFDEIEKSSDIEAFASPEKEIGTPCGCLSLFVVLRTTSNPAHISLLLNDICRNSLQSLKTDASILVIFGGH